MKHFPIFPSHDRVDCFNCEQRIAPGRESAYARGSGEFMAYCPACDLATFYDLTAAPRPRAAILASIALMLLAGCAAPHSGTLVPASAAGEIEGRRL